ncbi:MAG: hypothetical protein ACK559_17195, partial [bacterium]
HLDAVRDQHQRAHDRLQRQVLRVRERGMVRGRRAGRSVVALRLGAGGDLLHPAVLPRLQRHLRRGLRLDARHGDVRLHGRVHEQLRLRRQRRVGHGLRDARQHRARRRLDRRQRRHHLRRRLGP